MEYKLAIYIPTYNRIEKIKNSIALIAFDIEKYINDVIVIVSDNHSNDGTFEWLKNQEYKWLTSEQNSKNLGAAKNIVKGYDLEIQSKFVWIIGDDDYVIPGSIGDLLSIIDNNEDIDYIYCNTTAYSHNSETDQKIISSVLQTGTIPSGSSLKSKKYVGENKVLFNQLIDPEIADTLLGELMVNCFRKNKLNYPKSKSFERIDYLEFQKQKNDSDLYEMGELYQHHNIPFITNFNKNTIAFYSDKPRTFNFWGSAEWLDNYDYVFPIVILFLIEKYYSKKFILEEKYFSLLKYYYQGMGNSLIRQLKNNSTAHSFNQKIKSQMFDSSVRFMYSTK